MYLGLAGPSESGQCKAGVDLAMLQTLKGSSAIIAIMEVSKSIWCSWFKARAATICSRKRTLSKRQEADIPNGRVLPLWHAAQARATARQSIEKQPGGKT